MIAKLLLFLAAITSFNIAKVDIDSDGKRDLIMARAMPVCVVSAVRYGKPLYDVEISVKTKTKVERAGIIKAISWISPVQIMVFESEKRRILVIKTIDENEKVHYYGIGWPATVFPIANELIREGK